ncbi:MAG: Choline-sulfatase, partial [Myxococcaceae bacterium]|nr:Choline-sulfatase [Myxococcaceae bacterium]
AWVPDERVWNMSEGSFDQREAIFAPTPATLSFHVAVPPSARFSFSAGLGSDPIKDETRFVVTAVDAQGTRTEVCSVAIAPHAPVAWHDATCSLEPWAGRTIDLELKTSSAAGAPPALALWGNPTLSAKAATKAPYNVLFIVVDALRNDVVPSFHDDAEDAKKRGALVPPLEALLPKIPGLTPAIDELAAGGARFLHAYSNATWTRSGTIAMFAGERSGEAGIDAVPWVITEPALDHWYKAPPPLLALELRKAGMATRAFVNNFFMIGYAGVGVDMGFERVDDYRYRTKDTQEITADATRWIKENADQRFFVFCNYNSPHEPWDPPKRFLDKIPKPPAGPREDIVRNYMAEAGKDDEAIGVLMRALDEAKVKNDTLVIVTADHGETLSSAHAGFSELDHMKVRFHHAATHFEETTRVPVVVALPGVVPAGKAVGERVRSIDLAPTVLDIEGLPRDPRMTGRSMMPLVRSEKEADERVVVSEGRSSVAIVAGKYRLVVRQGKAQEMTIEEGAEKKKVTIPEELYDLDEDPGERRNLASAALRDKKKDVLAEMHARLKAALKNIPVAGTAASTAPATADRATVHLRFAGAGAARRISGTLTSTGNVTVDPIGLAKEAFSVHGGKIDLALVTSPAGVVGLDVHVEPPSADLTWQLFLDDAAWPERRVFAGPFGLADATMEHGIASDEARAAVRSNELPEIDPARDLGLFVTRASATDGMRRARSGEGASEMKQLLQDWGYAHGPVDPRKGLK